MPHTGKAEVVTPVVEHPHPVTVGDAARSRILRMQLQRGLTFGGLQAAEVADITHAPVGTVMSRLSRARAEIARYLEEDNIVPLRRSE